MPKPTVSARAALTRRPSDEAEASRRAEIDQHGRGQGVDPRRRHGHRCPENGGNQYARQGRRQFIHDKVGQNLVHPAESRFGQGVDLVIGEQDSASQRKDEQQGERHSQLQPQGPLRIAQRWGRQVALHRNLIRHHLNQVDAGAAE